MFCTSYIERIVDTVPKEVTKCYCTLFSDSVDTGFMVQHNPGEQLIVITVNLEDWDIIFASQVTSKIYV